MFVELIQVLVMSQEGIYVKLLITTLIECTSLTMAQALAASAMTEDP